MLKLPQRAFSKNFSHSTGKTNWCIVFKCLTSKNFSISRRPQSRRLKLLEVLRNCFFSESIYVKLHKKFQKKKTVLKMFYPARTTLCKLPNKLRVEEAVEWLVWYSNCKSEATHYLLSKGIKGFLLWIVRILGVTSLVLRIIWVGWMFEEGEKIVGWLYKLVARWK